MRIVYMLNSLGIGGAERQALAIADRMALRGHSVAILLLGSRLEDEWPTELRVIPLDIRRTPSSALRGLLKARRFLREFRPGTLHSHSFHANILARLLKLFRPSIKVVSTVHNVYQGGWRRMVAYRFTDCLASHTTAVSQAAADRFIRLQAVPVRKCSVLSNGIDTAEFTPNADRRRATRQAMGSESSFIWLAAGRLVSAKDYPNLLRAFKQVRALVPDAHLWIAASPADAIGAGPLDRRLVFVSGFAIEHGSMDNVRLLGLRRDMPALLDAADAFVLSSAWEGMPLAVGEAMAMEKPVVATDAGGTRELVGAAGIIVQVGDAEVLAASMLDLMRQPAESRLAMGRAARARIASRFNIEARADAWESIYQSILR